MDAALPGFEGLLRLPERALDLARGALEIARVEHPDLTPAPWLARLDALAARSGAEGIRDRVHALHRLREFLFEEEGFTGNTEAYYDPRNSCLNDVLDRRLGIPITLAIVLMEVGRRIGLKIVGVGLPGHFVVRAHVASEPVLLDPFDGGGVLTQERAAALVARAVGRRVELGEDHFAPVTKRQIFGRMLLNLRGVYTQRHDWEKALRVFDRLLLLDGDAAAHLRDRGMVLSKLGRVHRAAADWERYLTLHPHGEDAGAVREHLKRAREQLALLN